MNTTHTQVQFRSTREEMKAIVRIVRRFLKLSEWGDESYQTLVMDLDATNSNGCPMDFAKMEEADDFNLAHDMYGIHRHLNRETGQLENCFLPRCSKH